MECKNCKKLEKENERLRDEKKRLLFSFIDSAKKDSIELNKNTKRIISEAEKLFLNKN